MNYSINEPLSSLLCQLLIKYNELKRVILANITHYLKTMVTSAACLHTCKLVRRQATAVVRGTIPRKHTYVSRVFKFTVHYKEAGIESAL